MIERVEERFEVKPKQLIGDTAYDAAPMLGWLVQEKQIEPHIPVLDKADLSFGFVQDRNDEKLAPTWRIV